MARIPQTVLAFVAVGCIVAAATAASLVAAATVVAGPGESPVVELGRAPAVGPVTVAEIVARAAGPDVFRIAGRSCGGFTAGTGFVAEQQFVTAAHVAGGAVSAESVAGPVVLPRVWSSVGDADVVFADGAGSDGWPMGPVPETGARVFVVGHPDGGPLVVAAGHVGPLFKAGIYHDDVASFGVAVDDAVVVGGFSGGPVIDTYGNAVGVIWGSQQPTGLALAIDIDSVHARADADGALGDCYEQPE